MYIKHCVYQYTNGNVPTNLLFHVRLIQFIFQRDAFYNIPILKARGNGNLMYRACYADFILNNYNLFSGGMGRNVKLAVVLNFSVIYDVISLTALIFLFVFFLIIHYSDAITRLRLESLASWLFTQPFVQAQIKQNITAPRHWPLWGEFTGDRWIPRTKGQ